MTAPTTARTYNLGAVLPHVRKAAELVGPMFGVQTILGWRATAVDMGGHPAGLALDFMCSTDQGNRIAAYCLGQAGPLGVKYVIWRQTYTEPGKAPEPMEDRGSPTQNHMDHVHVSFKVTGGNGQPVGAPGDYNPGGGLLDGLNPFSGAAGVMAGVGDLAVKIVALGTAVALFVVGAKKIASNGNED